MLSCWREGILPMIQVHDSLESSVATREQGEMIARLGEEAVKLSVPMRVDLKFGANWADAEHSWEELTGEAQLNGATYHMQLQRLPFRTKASDDRSAAQS